MENLTIIGTNLACGLALLLFGGAVWFRNRQADISPDAPPELPFGKVPVWPYRKSDLIGVFGIAGFFFLMAVSNAAVADSGGSVKISAFGLVFNMGILTFFAVLSLMMVVARIKPVQWLGLKWKEWPWVFLIAPAAVFMMWAVFAGLHYMGYMEFLEKLGMEKVQDTVKVLQQEQDPLILILMAFTAAIVAPVCEEIVFRGYLYPVSKKFAGPWVAGICSALIFSAAHGHFAALLPLFVFGLVLVAIYEFTGSIWAPIAVHFCFNSATLLVQMLVRFGIVPDVPG